MQTYYTPLYEITLDGSTVHIMDRGTKQKSSICHSGLANFVESFFMFGADFFSPLSLHEGQRLKQENARLQAELDKMRDRAKDVTAQLGKTTSILSDIYNLVREYATHEED